MRKQNFELSVSRVLQILTEGDLEQKETAIATIDSWFAAENAENLKELQRCLNEWFAGKWGQWVTERPRLRRLRYIMVSRDLPSERDEELIADIHTLDLLPARYRDDRILVKQPIARGFPCRVTCNPQWETREAVDDALGRAHIDYETQPDGKLVIQTKYVVVIASQENLRKYVIHPSQSPDEIELESSPVEWDELSISEVFEMLTRGKSGHKQPAVATVDLWHVAKDSNKIRELEDKLAEWYVKN